MLFFFPSWSPYNRYLASSSVDWNVIVWDLRDRQRAHTLRFDAPVSSVHFSSTSRYERSATQTTAPCHSCSPVVSSIVLVVVLQTQQAIIVDLRKRKRQQSTTWLTNGVSTGNGQSSHSTAKRAEAVERRTELGVDGEWSGTILSATFAADGETIVAGTSKGDLLVFDAETQVLLHRISGGPSGVREVAFDRPGR